MWVSEQEESEQELGRTLLLKTNFLCAQLPSGSDLKDNCNGLVLVEGGDADNDSVHEMKRTAISFAVLREVWKEN